MSRARDILAQPDRDVADAVKKLLDRAMGAGGDDPDKRASEALLALYEEAERAGDARVTAALARPESRAIYWAAEHGHAPIIKALIAAGVDPKLTGMANIRPINEAVRKGHVEVIEALVAAGEDPNYAGFFGTPLLVYAARDDQLDVARALLRSGADPGAKAGDTGRTVLISAAKRADADFVRFAVERGADVNAADDQGRTALLEASEAGNLDAVRALIRLGADVNYASRLRPIEAIEAEGRGNPLFSSGVWRKLRKLEADPQETALILAAKAGHAAVVQALLDAGADPLLRDKQDRSAYDWASRKGNKAAADALRGSGAAPGLSDLLRAAEADDIETVRAALDAGIDINAKDRPSYEGRHNTIRVIGGSPALVLAAGNGNLEIVQELLAHGADVNAMGERASMSKGQTALHAAAENGFLEIVRLLIAAGANVNTKELGMPGVPVKTALQLASDEGHKEVVAELRRVGARRPAKKAPRPARPAPPPPDDECLPPDFSDAEKGPAFKAAVREFTQRLGKPEADYEEVSGGAFFKTTHETARQIVEQEQARRLDEGLFLFRTAPDLPHDEADTEYVGLFATADKYQALAAMATAGATEGGTSQAVAVLREIERTNPFVVWFCSEDAIDGQFLGTVKAAGRVARLLYELCPDIVSQGVGSVALLGSQLRNGRRLFLWWD